MEMASIAEFYAGRCIFMTGATGFVGKVLLEKLLRSCPAVRRVYLLIRPKKGHSVQARLDALLDSKLFDNIREAQHGFRAKVVPVAGDILDPGLGLSEADVKLLVSDVTIVFHSAATVKFDEPLKLSVQMNVIGVSRLLDLCHQMKRLEALVHISTAYANCDQRTVMEVVYPSPICPHRLVSAMEWMDDDVVDVLTRSLIGVRPNTYTFTKAVAESLLVERSRGLPCAVVRPSIVGASLREPIEGWVDNFNGPSGILAAIGKGLLRTMIGNSDAVADIIPVDTAVNLIIAVGWCTALEQRSNEVQVYNCTTGQSNKVTWGQIEQVSKDFYLKIPLDAPIRLPNPAFTLSRIKYALNNWFDQLLPAWCMDMALKLMGRKPVLIKLHSRLWKSVQCLQYFTSHEWTFTNDQVVALHDRMTADDQQEFNFDARRIDWPRYLHNYCLGVKLHALHESLDNLPRARHAILILRCRRLIKQCVLLAGGLLLCTRLAPARRLLFWLLSICMRVYARVRSLAIAGTVQASLA